MLDASDSDFGCSWKLMMMRHLVSPDKYFEESPQATFFSQSFLKHKNE